MALTGSNKRIESSNKVGMKQQQERRQSMQAAIYASVSTPGQGKEQTIDSQLSELSSWAQAQQHTVDPRHLYRDEGYSGSQLDRPALDALRDAAAAGEFELLGVLSPDRLARTYA